MASRYVLEFRIQIEGQRYETLQFICVPRNRIPCRGRPLQTLARVMPRFAFERQSHPELLYRASIFSGWADREFTLCPRGGKRSYIQDLWQENTNHLKDRTAWDIWRIRMLWDGNALFLG